MMFLLQAFAVVLAVFFSPTRVEGTCGNGGNNGCTVDIVFVMDSSLSVTAPGWSDSVVFVNGIIDALGSPSNVGIIEFNGDADTIYGMCADQSDCSTIQNALSTYGFQAGGSTNIPAGVQAGKIMLESGCGNPANPKVLVLLTDGFGGNPCGIDLTGITPYLVKVAGGTTNTAIDCLVGNPSTDIFTADTFDEIMELTDQLASAVCQEDQCDLDVPYCDASPSPCSCSEAENCQVCNDPAGCAQCKNGYLKLSYDTQCISCSETFGDGCMFCADFHGCQQCRDGYQRVILHECSHFSTVDVYGCEKLPPCIKCDEDVIIAIDESASLDDTELAIELEFANNLIDMIDDGAEFGVLAFGRYTRVLYDLSLGDATGAKTAISGLDRTGIDISRTNFIDTINAAITMFGSDNGRPNVLVIVSDGRPTTGNPCASNPSPYKQALDAAGVTVVIVGVGNGFDPDSTAITCLVDNPDEQIFFEPDFTSGALNAILLDVAFEVCGYVCPNGGTTSEPDLDPFTGCPIPCDENNPNNPCQCNQLCFCNICHSPEGCDECLPGYFKKNYNYPCVACDETIFGEHCLFCQDFHGCGQCEDGYTRVLDNTCGLYKCV